MAVGRHCCRMCIVTDDNIKWVRFFTTQNTWCLSVEALVLSLFKVTSLKVSCVQGHTFILKIFSEIFFMQTSSTYAAFKCTDKGFWEPIRWCPNQDCCCNFQYDHQNYRTSSLLVNIIFFRFFVFFVTYLWFLLHTVHTELWPVLGSYSEESVWVLWIVC
jgi:hypothetical protein